VANEKGYYRDEGLDVAFLEGGQGFRLTDPVVDGRADFAIVAPEDVFAAQTKGQPIVAVAAIYRRSAAVFVSLADSGIVRPDQFAGKTVATLSVGDSNRDFEIQFRALMKKTGVDAAGIRLLAYDPEYKALIDGSADVSAAYLTGGVVTLRRQGHRLNLIWPGDYGIDFYSDTLVTGQQMIAEKPDLVTRFVRATLKGWREAVGDPDQAVALTMKYARVKDKAFQTAMMDALLPMVHTGQGQIGQMSADNWKTMHAILVEQQVLPGPLPALDRVYDLRFLDAVYGEKRP